jgi:hypothetical protein
VARSRPAQFDTASGRRALAAEATIEARLVAVVGVGRAGCTNRYSGRRSFTGSIHRVGTLPMMRTEQPTDVE